MSGPGATVCNIAGRGRRRRGWMGAIAGAAVIALFAGLDGRIEPRAWRLALVPLVLFAFLCGIQAQEST